jgi:hypothetical protein
MSKLGMEINVRVFVTNEATEDELDELANEVDKRLGEASMHSIHPLVVEFEWDIS